MKIPAWAIAIPILLPVAASAADPLPFTRARLLRPASIERILVDDDLTGDGRPDILVQQSHELALFVQTPEGAFPYKPNQKIRLPEDVFAWCLGRVDASPQRRICLFTPEGVRAIPAEEGKLLPPSELLVHPTLFSGTGRRPPVYCNLLTDLDGDGDGDAVLPQRDGFSLFKQSTPGQFDLNQRIPYNFAVTRSQWGSGLGRLVVAFAIPPFLSVDLLGLGAPQFVVFDREAVRVYPQDAGGRFSPEPAPELSLRGKRHKPRLRFVRYELPPSLVDLDNDGATDIVLVLPSRGDIYVFRGTPGRSVFPTLAQPRAPDDLKKIDAYIPKYWIHDLNGDGLKDLALATVEKVNVFSGLQIFLTRQVDIKLMVFLARPGTLYGRDPDYVQPFTVPLTLYMTRESGDIDMPFFPNFDGDFNRDGLKDLVIKRTPTALAVFPGVREGVFAPTPLFEVPIDAIFDKTSVFVTDLNRDGRSDLVLHHVDWETMFPDVELYISK